MPTPPRRLLLRLAAALVLVGAGSFVFFARTRPRSPGAEAARTTSSGPAGPPGSPGRPGEGRVVPVLVTPVERRDVPLWLDGLGTVAAWQQVTVRPQVDGRLIEVYFREGQTVRRGQVLAQIDPRPFLIQLHQAEGALARDRAQLSAARLNLERYRTLRKDELVAPQQVDDQTGLVGQAEGTVQIDLAAVESARLNLDYARIQSPIDGVVGVRLVDPGNLVRAADPTGIVVVTQLDPVAVLFTLPQDELPRLGDAQRRGEVVVEAWSRDGQTRIATGQLLVIDNQINQATATLRLKAALPNPERRLWPNQFVKARLLLETRRGALVVPAAAVQRGPEGTFVYVVGAGETASARPVTVALTTADIAVIGEGLQAGEQVVIEGQNQLRPGARVAPRGAADKSGAPRGAKDKSGAPRGDSSPGRRPR